MALDEGQRQNRRRRIYSLALDITRVIDNEMQGELREADPRSVSRSTEVCRDEGDGELASPADAAKAKSSSIWPGPTSAATRCRRARRKALCPRTNPKLRSTVDR